MKIPHSKPFVDAEDVKAVTKQTKSGMHATGENVKEFESEMCKLIGKRYGKATSSGTTALHIALLALNIKKGDEVIIPSYVCQAVLNAVNYTGAKPVLVDIDLNFKDEGFNVSAKTIERVISKKTKAIIVPHLFGHAAEIDKIVNIANKYNIPVIED